jgi:hypothetical protein
VKTNLWLVQHKQTGSKTHAVSAKNLADLRHNAIQESREPLYMFEFDAGDTYYVINKGQFAVLQEAYESLNDVGSL